MNEVMMTGSHTALDHVLLLLIVLASGSLWSAMTIHAMRRWT
jgi:hypothetical protein